MQDEEYIHNEEAGSTAEDFIGEKPQTDNIEPTDGVCYHCGGHEVSRYKRGATEWDLTNQYECAECGATWED